MNRKQRRAEKPDGQPPVKSEPPHLPYYQINYNVHLPADPPWRKENHNKHRVAVAHDPLTLWQGAIFDLLDLVGLQADASLTVGVLLEIINRLPEEIRRMVADGVVAGNGLSLIASAEGVVGDIHPKFDALAKAGVKRRPSGLIVPEGVENRV